MSQPDSQRASLLQLRPSRLGQNRVGLPLTAALPRVLQGGDEFRLRQLHLVALEQRRQRRHGDRRQHADDGHHHHLLDQGDAALPVARAASLLHRHRAFLHGRKDHARKPCTRGQPSSGWPRRRLLLTGAVSSGDLICGYPPAYRPP